MKKIDKLAIIIFNLCLLLTAGITPALLLASSPEYYYEQFEKNGIYASVDENGDEQRSIIKYVGGDKTKYATFSDEQLNLIIHHIIDYLFTDKEDFELKMDGVEIIGEGICDGVDIFGETAVLHMADVKSLMKFAKWAAIICFLTAVSLLIMFIKREKMRKHLLKYTAVFYGLLGGFAFLFCLWSLLGAKRLTTTGFLYQLWGNMHYLLFPFQPEKVKNSVISDTLTQILTLELFMAAVAIVAAVIVSVLAAWLIVACILHKRAKIKNN